MKMSRRLLFLALGIEGLLAALTVWLVVTAKGFDCFAALLLQWPAVIMLAPLKQSDTLLGIVICGLIFGIQTCLIWLGLCGLRALWPKSSGWQVGGRPVVAYASWERIHGSGN